jgi:hypothetical protein
LGVQLPETSGGQIAIRRVHCAFTTGTGSGVGKESDVEYPAIACFESPIVSSMS